MAVYVDDARNPLGRMIMCHMLADTIEDLLEMAMRVGMREEWYQPTSFPHFDLSLSRRRHAISLGAIETDRRGIVVIKRQLRADPAFIASISKYHSRRGIPIPTGVMWG